jgi:hypothetical protein
VALRVNTGPHCGRSARGIPTIVIPTPLLPPLRLHPRRTLRFLLFIVFLITIIIVGEAIECENKIPFELKNDVCGCGCVGVGVIEINE